MRSLSGQPGWAWEFIGGYHGGPGVDSGLSHTLLRPGKGLGQVMPTPESHFLISKMGIFPALPTSQSCPEASSDGVGKTLSADDQELGTFRE